MPFADLMKEQYSLADLMEIHKCDKWYNHHYEGEYERHFEAIRDKPLKILEIGVGGYTAPECGGEGLAVWRDYFPNATIHGLDVYTKRLDLGPRVTLWRGAQSDSIVLNEIHESGGPFDIVIDDGSHEQEDILKSFQMLFPLMSQGGIYVIEDLHCAYDSLFGGDPEFGSTKQTVRLMLLGAIEALHWEFIKDMPDVPMAKMVKSIHVSKKIVFIYKHD